MTRSSSADAAMADPSAEVETLRELMRQPAMSIGMGLVAVGCAGLLLAIGWLWWMPPSSRIAASPAETAAAHDPQKQLPATSASGALAQDLVLPKASESAAERPAALPETTPPSPAETAAAATGGAVATAAPLPEPAPSSEPAATAAAAPPEIAAPAPAEAPDAMTVAAPPAAVTAPAPSPVASAAPALPATEARGYRLQLGAMRTPESAQQVWDQLQHQHSDVLGKLAYAAPRVDLGNRGVFYRIQAGPLPDAATAKHACTELKQRGVSCILVKP